jgi:hypothetical protein
MIRDIPNALFEADGNLGAFLAAEMNRALQHAIDQHVTDSINAASPDSSAGTSSDLLEELRYAKAELADKGVAANLAILTPESGVTVDLVKEIDMPRGFPFGIRFAESSSADTDYLVEPARAGVLYLGSVKFDRDPYTGFSRNTTNLRAEASLLMVIRDSDAIMGIVPAGS